MANKAAEKANNIWQAYRELPSAVQIIIAAGVAYGTYRGVKGIANYVKSANEREAAKAVGKDIKDFEKEGIKSQLTDAQIKIIGNQLYDAMNGCGQNSSTVISLLQGMNNDTEMARLIKDFGVRKNSCWATGSSNQSLPTMVRSEIGGSALTILNSNLKDKGLKYKF